LNLLFNIYFAMKKVFYILLALVFVSSCSTTREAKSSRTELRREKKLAEAEIVKKAIESKRFIVRFDRIYSYRGGIADLRPKANYIIVDREMAVINAAYMGRQFDVRPIAGITMRGGTVSYVMTSDALKGKYSIGMKVQNGGDSFDVNLTITNDGSCNASLSGMRIDNVRYSGHIIPIKDKKITIPENSIKI
jgi:hypothetical protein